MSHLKVVALISGGKDSFFSILHCLANRHDIVALANLYPPLQQDGTSVEDSDSFMYQTIGHAVIPLYEEALGLPLYRQEILGSAVNQSKSYGPEAAGDGTGADETESLTTLLLKVKSAHPEINAVSTGAILSDYQRTRVESVALRLGLTPLSYLWQYPHLPPSTQISLLEDMTLVGQDARIIKVASGGMDHSFLWQNVGDARTRARLVKASQRFGTPGDGSVLGEGGEYETLAISGPGPLWKARIVVDDQDRQTLPGEAGSASVRIAKARVEPLENARAVDVRIPVLLDERFQSLLEDLVQECDLSSSEQTVNAAYQPRSSRLSENTLLVESLSGPGQDAGEQTTAIMAKLEETLKHSGHNFIDVAYTSIILRDMSDFASVNAAYGKHFAYANPPARLTLACADVLPDDALVMVSASSVKTVSHGDRKGLHVQSRSYWAPANIGPYSQAITVPCGEQDEKSGLVFVAGQIPLVPSSMELYAPHGSSTEATFTHQAILALQHLDRIGKAVDVKGWVSVIAFITASAPDRARLRAAVAKRLWHSVHRPAEQESQNETDDENEDFDVWHQAHGQGHTSWQQYTTLAEVEVVPAGRPVPPITVIQVDSLPRGASVEWVAYGAPGSASRNVSVPHLSHLLNLFKRRIVV